MFPNNTALKIVKKNKIKEDKDHQNKIKTLAKELKELEAQRKLEELQELEALQLKELKAILTQYTENHMKEYENTVYKSLYGAQADLHNLSLHDVQNAIKKFPLSYNSPEEFIKTASNRNSQLASVDYTQNRNMTEDETSKIIDMCYAINYEIYKEKFLPKEKSTPKSNPATSPQTTSESSLSNAVIPDLSL